MIDLLVARASGGLPGVVKSPGTSFLDLSSFVRCRRRRYFI